MKKNLQPCPLTSNQMGVFLECMADLSGTQYNIFFEYTFDKNRIDAHQLAKAHDKAISNYVAYATQIQMIDGEPHMVVRDEPFPETQVLFMNEAAYRQVKESFIHPFELLDHRLWRAQVVETEKSVYLMTEHHHLIFDGTSYVIISQAISAAYEGRAIPEETRTIFDISQEEKTGKNSDEYRKSEAFYERYLADAEVDSVPIPDQKPEASRERSGLIFYPLSAEVKSLETLAKTHGVTENIVIFSAFAYALSLFNAQKSVMVASFESGRYHKQINNTVGFFVRTFPVFFQLKDDAPIGELLHAAKEAYFGSLKHDNVPFMTLAEKYGLNPDVKYIYQDRMLDGIPINGCVPKIEVYESDSAMSAMDFMVIKEEQYKIRLTYKANAYSRELMEAFLDLVDHVVRGMLTANQLKDIDLLSEKALDFIERVNDTKLEYDHNLTVDRYFDVIVEKFPEHIAVVDENRSYTYAEVEKLSGKIAGYLSEKGIGRDDFVGLYLPRTADMIISATGVMRAGAAIEPLDPSYPDERMNFMLEDSGAKWLIADRSLGKLPTAYKGEVLYTDEIDNLPDGTLNIPPIAPQDAFSIIYTSGTTGKPKGCVIMHRNFVALFESHRQLMHLDENSRIAHYASFGFDAGMMDYVCGMMSGAAIYLIPDEIRLDLKEIENYYNQHGITYGFMTTQVGRLFCQQAKCPTLKTFFMGGEKLVPFTPPEGIQAFNGYGPCETLAYISIAEVLSEDEFATIGKPTANSKVYITDLSTGRLLPPGCCGELCISGPQVSRGYLNRPDKTSEVFVANPFSTEPGYEWLYKSGDVVRLLTDGRLEFVGRRDAQVKIRGFRVELTEVEQVIQSYPGIRDVTVNAYEDSGSGKYLAACIVADETIDIQALNAHIAEQKPPYMVPAVTMQIDALPFTVNGKVDRRKLPKPERRMAHIIPPETALQKEIHNIVAEVVGTEQLGIDTPLYELGLSSISSIRLCSLLAEALDMNIAMRDLRQNDTVRKLEAFIEKKRRPQDEMAGDFGIQTWPLTKTQEGVFFECINKPDSTVYNMPLLLKIDTNVAIEKLKQAIVAAVSAHPAMKTILGYDDHGRGIQSYAKAMAYATEDIEETFCDALDLAGLVRPFVLTGERLFRFKLIHADGLYLFFDIHHIIGDGFSVKLLLHDIEKAYRGEVLVEESFSAFDVAEDEAGRRKTDELPLAKGYYEKLLSGLDVDFLPYPDRLAEAPQDDGQFNLKGMPVEKAVTYCQTRQITMNALLCSVFGFVLSKYNGTGYAIFNTIYNGRNDSRLQNTVSMLVKTFPVVCQIKNTDVNSLVKKIGNQILDSMAYDLYAYSEMARDFGLRNDVMFIFQGDHFGFSSFCGLRAEEVPLTLSESKAAMTLQVFIEDHHFKYCFDYDAGLFTEKLIAGIISAFEMALTAFCEESSLHDISLVSDEMMAEMDALNATEYNYDRSLSIVDHFRVHVERDPEKLLIAYQDHTYTYGEVWALTGKIARYLNQRGIGKGDIVAILIYRDENMVIGAHGVVRAGAAYLGLDPAYPPERIEFLLKDSGSRVLIADRRLAHLAKDFEGEILYTDDIENLEPCDDFDAGVTPENNAIIIYSSGTTGTPKGSVLGHDSIVCFFHNYRLDNDFGPHSRVATYASFGFDGGAMDVFSVPMCGGSLYIVPDEIRLDLEKIEDFYIQNQITNGFMTTQVGCMFIGNTQCQSLTHFMVGGEKFIPVTAPDWVTFYNGYGPSETMCYVNRYVVNNRSTLQPIGKVSRNTKEYIIDPFGHRLPYGACGELCISGGQLGRGYLNREEQTAKAFVDNPFADITDPSYQRMYKTGDILRMLPDGNYDFIGRRDGQVKIRGFRVELTEIEQRIEAFDGIKTSTVQAYDHPAGGKYLVAYIVADHPVDVRLLNAFIEAEKPKYMVPAVTMQLDEIPLTANGKVDKRSLPKPEKALRQEGRKPENRVEKDFCQIYQDVLGVTEVYADDDFFEIGGSSITAIQVVVQANHMGYDIVFKNLFANPTPEALSDFLSHNGDPEHGGKELFASAKGFDGSCLAYNVIDNLPHIKNNGVGDVLLTGVTGFLGIHVFKELMENGAGQVICLIRKKDDLSALDRLRLSCIFYFEDWDRDDFYDRVKVVEGEFNSADLIERLKAEHFDTIINCAANVKHFAAGDSLLKDNFSGVEKLIELAEITGARLVQMSSLSVGGQSVNGHIPGDFIFKENNLVIGQSLENQYIYSKYLAERAILDAISRGKIRGKVIRLGNLMPRINDSQFQINAGSNGFLRQFIGFRKLKAFPVDQMDAIVEYSPIDAVARATVLLAGTPDEFTVFHAKNANTIHYVYLLRAMIQQGMDIEIVEDDEFARRLKQALEQDSDISDFSGFVAYMNRADSNVSEMTHYTGSNEEEKTETSHEVRVNIGSDTRFTTKALYRLGFSWPLVSEAYLEKMVEILMEVNLF